MSGLKTVINANGVISPGGKTVNFTLTAEIPIQFAENFRHNLLAALRAHADECAETTETLIDTTGDAAMPKALHVPGGEA